MHQFFKRDSIIKILETLHMYVLSYFFSQSAKNSSEFGHSTFFLVVSFLVAWLGAFKNYMDQILPNFDHLPSLSGQLCKLDCVRKTGIVA